MDKQKLLEWMRCVMDMTSSCVRPEDRDTARDKAYDIIFGAGGSDANCASIKDQTDAQPPSPWPSLARIEREVIARTIAEVAPRVRKETRAEVVAEIAAYLESDAAKFRTASASIRGAHDSIVANAFEAAARVIRGKFG